MNKQTILQQLQMDGHDAETVEDLTKIINAYPEDLDDAQMDSLLEEIDQYSADSAMLAQAWSGLSDNLEDYANSVTSAAEDAVTEMAKEAKNSYEMVSDLLDE